MSNETNDHETHKIEIVDASCDRVWLSERVQLEMIKAFGALVAIAIPLWFQVVLSSVERSKNEERAKVVVESVKKAEDVAARTAIAVDTRSEKQNEAIINKLQEFKNVVDKADMTMKQSLEAKGPK